MENGASGPWVFLLIAPMQTASNRTVVRIISATTAPATWLDSWTVAKAAPEAFQNLSSGVTACGKKMLNFTVEALNVDTVGWLQNALKPGGVLYNM